jgi:molybdopterin molybdotransferase
MAAVQPTGDYAGLPLPDDARAAFEAVIQPVVRRELVSLDAALGRYLAADVYSPIDLPEFPRSMVDGYAVVAADLVDASSVSPIDLPLAGEVRMGTQAAVTVRAGTAVKIHTGAMMPSGADAVAMVEWTEPLADTRVRFMRGPRAGANTIAVAEDVRRGQLLLRAGRRLRSDDIGGLAAIGYVEVPVARQPVVAVISGGDEVVAPHQTPGPGQVRDVNAAVLSAMVEELGARPWRLGIGHDDPAEFHALVEQALSGADMVVVTGGSSVGTRDVTRDVVESFPDAQIVVHGIALRPGKPTLLARVKGIPFFGLPGNPVSAVVTFRLFAAPVIVRALGGMPTQRVPVAARLVKAIPPSGGREDYVQCRLWYEDGEVLAEPVAGKSNLIFTVVRGDGLVRVPIDQQGAPVGTVVRVWQY